MINVVVFCTAALVAFSPWLIKNQIMTGNPVFPLVNGLFDAAPPGWGPEQTRTWDSGHLLSPRQSQPMERLSALWTRIPGDRYQRFGPLLLLLPFVGLLWRSRGRADAMLLVLLFLQVAAWLLATHLYARFAVVMLIPLALLCGRALAGRPGFRRTWIVAAALVIGASWNFAVASRLHHDESPAGAPASLIYNGNLRGYEYFRVVNNELPEDARILLIGDAKAFYFRRRVDYCVVFNRNPFVEAVRAARTDAEIIAWLQDRAYTHVLVNWSEVNRLRRTYGFADEITPGWFDGLGPLGLEVMAEFLHPASSKRYVTLYRVP